MSLALRMLFCHVVPVSRNHLQPAGRRANYFLITNISTLALILTPKLAFRGFCNKKVDSEFKKSLLLT